MEYVTCRTCKSPNTELEKGESRLYFVTCNSCGSRRSVTYATSILLIFRCGSNTTYDTGLSRLVFRQQSERDANSRVRFTPCIQKETGVLPCQSTGTFSWIRCDDFSLRNGEELEGGTGMYMGGKEGRCGRMLFPVLYLCYYVKRDWEII